MWNGDFDVPSLVISYTKDDYYVAVDLGSGWAVFRNKWDDPELITYYSHTLLDAEERANKHCAWLNNSIE